MTAATPKAAVRMMAVTPTSMPLPNDPGIAMANSRVTSASITAPTRSITLLTG